MNSTHFRTLQHRTWSLFAFALTLTPFALVACGDETPTQRTPEAGAAGMAGSAGTGGMGASGAPAESGKGGAGGSTFTAGKGGSGAGEGGVPAVSGAAGAAGTAGHGGDAGAAGDAAAGAGGSDEPDCMLQMTVGMPPRSARSAGFSGSDDTYAGLYDVTCESVDACVSACTTAGGSSESCSIGSECPASSGSERTCLPPTYWRNVAGALTPPGSTADAAVLTLVDIAYHDALILSDFGLSLPDGATLRGVGFTLQRASEGGLAIDESVRLVIASGTVGVNRSKTGAWSATLEEMSYGGEDELWGADLTIADVEAATFGLSLTPEYTDSAGNDRAYVTGVKAFAYYTTCD